MPGPRLSVRSILTALGLALVVYTIIDAIRPDGWSIHRVCTFERMGDFPGSDYVDMFSAAHDITDDASRVIGHGTEDTLPPGVTEYRVAASWSSPPPELVSLGYGRTPGGLGSLVESVAHAVSGDGKVVVGKATRESIEQPTFWVSKSIEELPIFSDSNVSGVAYDVSHNGKAIVGYVSPWADAKYYGAPRRAVHWDRSRGNTPTLLHQASADVPSNSSVAYSVSGHGETVVGALFDSLAGRGVAIWPALWRWSPGIKTFELTLLRGLAGEVAIGQVSSVSRDGRFAVGSLGVYPNQQPCFWGIAAPLLPPIKAQPIPLLVGDFNGMALCTDAGGTHVFGTRMSLDAAGDTLYHGFHWDGVSGVTEDMRVFLDSPAGTIPVEFDLGQVMGASAEGIAAVGAGFNGEWPEGWIVRCKIVHKPWWRKFIPFVNPPATKAPPPINPLGRTEGRS